MDKKEARSSLVKTPQLGIPIGEAVMHPDGSHAIRVKTAGCKATEEISLGRLVALVIAGTKARKNTEGRSPK